MKKFTCLNCGAVGDCERDKQFCNSRCYHQYRRKINKAAKLPVHPCLYNEGVDCLDGDSYSNCGWNPDVERIRREQILRRLGV